MQEGKKKKDAMIKEDTRQKCTARKLSQWKKKRGRNGQWPKDGKWPKNDQWSKNVQWSKNDQWSKNVQWSIANRIVQENGEDDGGRAENEVDPNVYMFEDDHGDKRDQNDADGRCEAFMQIVQVLHHKRNIDATDAQKANNRPYSNIISEEESPLHHSVRL